MYCIVSSFALFESGMLPADTINASTPSAFKQQLSRFDLHTITAFTNIYCLNCNLANVLLFPLFHIHILSSNNLFLLQRISRHDLTSGVIFPVAESISSAFLLLFLPYSEKTEKFQVGLFPNFHHSKNAVCNFAEPLNERAFTFNQVWRGLRTKASCKQGRLCLVIWYFDLQSLLHVSRMMFNISSDIFWQKTPRPLAIVESQVQNQGGIISKTTPYSGKSCSQRSEPSFAWSGSQRNSTVVPWAVRITGWKKDEQACMCIETYAQARRYRNMLL